MKSSLFCTAALAACIAYGSETDAEGFSVENFGYPVNLMIAQPSHIVRGTFFDCLRALSRA